MTEWVEWLGGERPVDADKVIDVKTRDGDVEENQRAGWFYWEHNNDECDIVAYRATADV